MTVMLIGITISFTIITIKEKNFSNLYEESMNIENIAIIKSSIKEKEKYNEFTVKIVDKTNKKGTNLVVNDYNKNNLEYGDIIKINGKYEQYSSYKNRGVFNYTESLKKKNIYGKIITSHIEKIDKKEDLNGIFIYLNRTIKEKFEKVFSKESSNILKALVLGDKQDIEKETMVEIQENGLSHLIAISGMHIGCIMIITKKILDIITYGERKKKIITIIILIIFIMTIGFISSAIRAVIMSIQAILAKLVYRKNNFKIDISIASLIILIYNPYYIIDEGFLLSFGATIGIIYVYPLFKKIKFNNKIANYFLQCLLLSISVNIFIFPINAFFFKKFSITGIITGIIAVPIIFAIEICGLISIFIPIQILNNFAPIIETLIKIFLQISKINLINFYMKVPNLLEIIIYYLIIYFVLKKNSRRIIKKVIVILILVNTISYLNFSKELRIYFIDVGQGDSTLIRTIENKNILIDGGGNDNYDIGKNVLIPYLLSKKISTIDYLIISHFDTDHVGRSYNSSRRIKCKKYYYK